jgi:hypothetical protein
MEARSQLRHRPTLGRERLTSFSTSKIDFVNTSQFLPESLLLPFRLTLVALVSTFLFSSQPLAHAAAPQAAVNPAQPRTQASLALGNALQQVSISAAHLRRSLDSINVSKWKAPGDVRQNTIHDVDSMQSDVAGTLPNLINTALGDPAKISPAFAVYRNVDALHDVLLRVSETAQLAGSNDARLLEEQRSALEDSRTQLGAALLQSSQAQDAEVVHLRTTAAAAPPPPPATKTVIDDGPSTKPKTTKKRVHKPAPKPGATTPQ